MNIRKTKSGWAVEVTHTICGCLESGGISGREELYSRDTLAAVGLAYDAGPDDCDLCEGATNLAYLRENCNPDRVLKAGRVIA